MYKIHQDIETPDHDTVIWKYLTYSKFIYLLEVSKLYFARADKFKDESRLTGTCAVM